MLYYVKINVCYKNLLLYFIIAASSILQAQLQQLIGIHPTRPPPPLPHQQQQGGMPQGGAPGKGMKQPAGPRSNSVPLYQPVIMFLPRRDWCS